MNKENRNLILFFLFTFAWTWALYAPMAFGGHNPYELPWLILLILGGMGPSLVGVAMVLLTCSKEQRRDYWIRCFSLRRIGIRWWLIIFLIFPAIYGLSIAIDVAMGGELPGMEMLRNLIANPLTIPLAAFISFMSGPWSEEFGWRGFALDRIIRPLGVIPGTVVLGVVWGVWHLPLYFMSNTWHGGMGFQLAGFWTFVLFEVGLSLIMTWVYLNTRLSILSAMLLHFTSNFTSQLIAPSSERFEIVRMILLLAFGLAACAIMLRSKQARPEFGQVKPAHQ